MNTKTLTERFSVSSADARIDTEAGVAYGVKLNGPRSANGRKYRREGLRKATPLYEGVKVYANHVEPDEFGRLPPRREEDLLGRMKGVKLGKDGHRADFHVRPSKRGILEDLKHDPELLGFSHTIEALVESDLDADGDEVIAEIPAVHSVDLVTDPATTSGLFEQREGDAKVSERIEKLLKEQADEQKARADKAEKALQESSVRAEKAEKELAATKALLEQSAKDKADLEAKFQAQEEAQKAAIIEGICSERGITDAKVKESLKALDVETAKALAESFGTVPAKSGGAPRSEGRAAPQGNVSDDAFLNALTGGIC